MRMNVVEVFTGNFGVNDSGRLVISGFRTYGDAFDWINRNICLACDGTGREKFKRDGYIVQDTPCPRCGGRGR